MRLEALFWTFFVLKGRGATRGQPDLRVHEALGRIPRPVRGGALQGPAACRDPGQGDTGPVPLPSGRALGGGEGGGARARRGYDAVPLGGRGGRHPQKRPPQPGELRTDRARDRGGPGGRIFW